MKKTIALAATIIFGIAAQAQTFEVPKNYKLKRPEDYPKYNKQVIACIDWVENTPLSTDLDKRRDAMTFLIDWISGSPDVTIGLDEKHMLFADKNKDLLGIYMAEWTRYAIDHPGEKDSTKCMVAAARAVVKFYKANQKVMQHDKHIEDLVALDEKGQLEEWAKEK